MGKVSKRGTKGGFDVNPQNINRKGRPKKEESMTYIIRKVASEEEVLFKGKKISGKEAVARKLIEMALGDNFLALQYFCNRLDGTPSQHVVQTDDVEDLGLTPEQRKERILELMRDRLDRSRGD